MADSEIQPGNSPRRVRLRKLLLASLVAVGIVVCGWFMGRGLPVSPLADRGASLHDPASAIPSERQWRASSGFVGSDRCRKCHPTQFDSYLETAHSRAMAEIEPDAEPADAAFDHPPSRHRFRSSHVDGRLVHSVSLLLNDGTESLQTRFPVKYRFGSGHLGKGYLVAADGYLVQSPISWYVSRQEWGLAPGYDSPGLPPFGRMVTGACLSCHSGSIDRSAASDFRIRLSEAAIGCERCHGPGQMHVLQQTAETPTDEINEVSIVNPGRLPRKLAEAVCHQCHLQGDIPVPGRGVRSEDFRPGELLERYRQEYQVSRAKSGMQAVGHVGQLAESACYRQSQTLTCITCHDPHAPISRQDRAEHYRSICLTCHGPDACGVALTERTAERANDCTACHMPGGATEMPHVASTHHQIGIHPLQADKAQSAGAARMLPMFDLTTLSLPDGQRSLGLAWNGLFVSLAGGGGLSSAIDEARLKAQKLLSSLPEEFVDAAVEVALAGIHYAAGDMRMAEKAGRRSLSLSNSTTEEKVAALELLGNICLQQNRYSDAADQFAELTRLRRDSQDWRRLGECEYQCRNLAAAARALETSRAIDPDNVETCAILAEAYRIQRDFAAEKRLREETARLRPPSAGSR